MPREGWGWGGQGLMPLALRNLCLFFSPAGASQVMGQPQCKNLTHGALGSCLLPSRGPA